MVAEGKADRHALALALALLPDPINVCQPPTTAILLDKMDE
jgi:hypothetical protein